MMQQSTDFLEIDICSLWSIFKLRNSEDFTVDILLHFIIFFLSLFTRLKLGDAYCDLLLYIVEPCGTKCGWLSKKKYFSLKKQ